MNFAWMIVSATGTDAFATRAARVPYTPVVGLEVEERIVTSSSCGTKARSCLTYSTHNDPHEIRFRFKIDLFTSKCSATQSQPLAVTTTGIYK